MEEEINKFTRFINENYNTDNRLIVEKYKHTLNVVKIILSIAKSMELTNDECMLAFYLGLFHDLGRFREVERQNRFNNLTFDHGAYSNKILFNDDFIKNFGIDPSDYLLIKKAIFYHNKKELPISLSPRERFFAELLRDADRIDIFRVCSNNATMFNRDPSLKVLNAFLNNESVDIHDVKNKSDTIILRINFVKLFSSYDALKVLDDLGYFKDYVSNIQVASEYTELFNSILKNIENYKEGVKKNVRQKIRSFNG